MAAGIGEPPGVAGRLRRTVGHFFRVSDPDAVEALLAEFRALEVRGGAWLFRQGDPADALFLIARGRLQVWGDAEGEGGAPRLLGELGSGESVGEVGLLTGGARTAGVRAIRDSVLLRLDRESFHRLAATHAALVLNLTAQVAERLRDRTAARGGAARGFENLALLPVGPGPRVERFAARLSAALETHDSVRHIDAGEAGAREESAIAEWLHEQGTRHRFLVLEAEPRTSAWSQLCRRQADVLLFVADAEATPSAGSWSGIERDERGARRILVLLHAGDAISGTARWLEALPADHVHHVRAGSEERDLARLARVLAGAAVGLVLGGGGARGFAHVGVLRALEEARIPVDWVGGSSIGSVFAAGRAFDWDAARIGALARRAFVEENPLGDYTLPLVSLLRGRRLRRLVLRHFDCDIEDLAIPFFCVSSHLDRGEVTVHERGRLWRAVRASVALPGVLPPVVIDGHLAVDGAILNNLPVDVMRERPVGWVIGVDLTARRERLALDYDEVPGPLELLSSRLLPFARRRSLPHIFSLMMKASLISSFAHGRAMHRTSDLVLTPPVERFGLLDVRSFDRIAAVGYEHARERLAAWKPPARTSLAASGPSRG